MTKRTKVVLLIVALAVGFFLYNALFSSNTDSARAKAGSVVRTVTREGPLTTWTVSGSGLCPRYPNGVLAGWVLTHRQVGPAPLHPEQYRYGPWIGSYCSNSKHVWGIEWGGGAPDGDPNSMLLWQWFPADSFKNHVVKQDTFASMKWTGHFGVVLGGVIRRDDYPWLFVRLSVDQNIDATHGCGCDF